MICVSGIIQRCLIPRQVASLGHKSTPPVSRHFVVTSYLHSSNFRRNSLHTQILHQQHKESHSYKESVESTLAQKDPDSRGKTDHVTKSTSKYKWEHYALPHRIWTAEESSEVKITHKKAQGVIDYMAYACVTGLRGSFDLFSGYTIKSYLRTLDERDMLRRCIFLESVAGVPGFAAAMIRHLHSLRRLKRDHGWIHTLLEEAENERMHLMVFLQLRKPGPIFRVAVGGGQMIFTAWFSLAYLISPHFCHRFVGYLEEQAVITYTHILKEMDAGKLPMWSKLPAPKIALAYWKLSEDATMRDVILAIRADEAHHREVNHTLGSMGLKEDNPFKPGE